MSESGITVIDLQGKLDSLTAFRRLAQKPHCAFLDSARRSGELGRYSFVVADPFEIIGGDAKDPLQSLAKRLALFSSIAKQGLPPFQGGAVGLFSYDLNHSLEVIPSARFDEFQTPSMFVGLYDVVLAFDHVTDGAWLISQGFPETVDSRRASRSRDRAELFLSWLQADAGDTKPTGECQIVLAANEMAPGFPTPHSGVVSNFPDDVYRETVERVIEYIRAGDVFQVNLAQRLLHRATTDSVSLYLTLRECNAAPFAGYFDLGSHQIVSASPERFLKLVDGHVETRPIKGTRQRSLMPEAELFGAEALKASRKDVSENVMIVDLMRNDLSRVCLDDSVVVSRLCQLETYQYVQHLVSVVQGQLRPELNALDLIRATFPGGSITGAPKVRAMEIIAELEPTARGAYCGSLGYVGFGGAMDLNILIRTITANRGWWQFPVGGGIVADSSPDSEYFETWHKAEGILQAIRQL